MKLSILAILTLTFQVTFGQNALPPVPSVYSNIKADGKGYYLEHEGKKVYELIAGPAYTLTKMMGKITGTAEGLSFDFDDFEGTMYYGFIPYGDSEHPMPVYFRRAESVREGKTAVPILGNLEGRYDMVKWAEKGYGTIGYRLVNPEGMIVYDGKVTFSGIGPFKVAPTIVQGPMVNKLQPDGATITLELNQPAPVSIEINGTSFSSESALRHEINLRGLLPATSYEYVVKVRDIPQSYYFKTAQKAGSREPFVFAYASDSRNGQGGGERNVYGANFYIMKKIMALAKFQDVAFLQFSGDLINGYLTNLDEISLQYANWKRAVEPFWHYFPIYASMGNHEALTRSFPVKPEGYPLAVDRFPFETESAEAIFANLFTHPENGPESEDGATYDPNPNQTDFPPYRENVFTYTYGNVAVVVLNSNYFYSPSTADIPLTGGGLHAYIMDQQLAWLEKTIMDLEANEDIDHVFVTQHTPFFPNGGHVRDDMWYNGNNDFRAYVAGKPLEKGIIERRDDLLDILVNKSSKVIAILTGDEHNYARTEVSPEMERYPEGWKMDKIELSRTIYQINNGAAGAPYYAQEPTPWTPHVSGFTTQNALVLFHVDGPHISMKVLNPDTLEEVDGLELR